MSKYVPKIGTVAAAGNVKFTPVGSKDLQLEQLSVTYASATGTIVLDVVNSAGTVVNTLYTSTSLSGASGTIDIRRQLCVNDIPNHVSTANLTLRLYNNTNVTISYNGQFEAV